MSYAWPTGIAGLAALLLVPAACHSFSSGATSPPCALTADHASNPLGIDTPRPRLAWKLSGTRRGLAQSAYRIVVLRTVGDSEEPVWDSGRVESKVSTGVAYGGDPLLSRRRYRWRVRLWDEAGNPSPWSGDAWFETGLLLPSDWSATWIARPVPPAAEVDARTSQLRKEFSLPKEVRSARLYSTALGDYAIEVNGSRVGDEEMAPGWTDYRKRLQYQVHDVTPLLRTGANALGASLSTGWYAGKIGAMGKDLYGSGLPGLLVQLEVTFADGSRTTVVSDSSWRACQGPVLSADHQDGEIYDARLETPGWASPGFDESAWSLVVEKRDVPPGMVLVARADPPVRKTQELVPVSIRRLSPESQIVDLGQNMVGVARLRVRWATPGSRITLRFAEVLKPDGSIYTENLRTALATDSYFPRGGPLEEWAPRFTFHGFRFVEVTGYPGDLDFESVTGSVLGTDAPVTGWFSTSNALINKLQSNILWSQRGNFLSIPTDCPQRDERLGWTGDIGVFAPTAAFNMDVSRFLGAKWLADVRDAQEASGAIPWIVPLLEPFSGYNDMEWGSAAVHVPYVLWQVYGDTHIVDQVWDVMVRAMDSWESAAGPTRILATWSYGDWLAFEESSTELLNTAWLKRNSDMMSAMATATGRDAAASHYSRLSDEVRSAFVARYVAADGSVSAPTAPGSAGSPLESQSQYVVALAWDILPDGLRDLAVERLVSRLEATGWHLATGFQGTPDLLTALSEAGRLDVAYRLLEQDTAPSWIYEVKVGATTTWERWNSLLADGSINEAAARMNSFNHYALGAVGSWMYRHIAGIRTDPRFPGYARTIIRPRPGGGLTSTSATFESGYGTIKSEWRLEGTDFLLLVTVPPNAIAEVHVPARDVGDVTESNVPVGQSTGVSFVRSEAGAAVFTVMSGTYYFRSQR
jgi:alpha-L-rhamnosidase